MVDVRQARLELCAQARLELLAAVDAVPRPEPAQLHAALYQTCVCRWHAVQSGRRGSDRQLPHVRLVAQLRSCQLSLVVEGVVDHLWEAIYDAVICQTCRSHLGMLLKDVVQHLVRGTTCKVGRDWIALVCSARAVAEASLRPRLHCLNEDAAHRRFVQALHALGPVDHVGMLRFQAIDVDNLLVTSSSAVVPLSAATLTMRPSARTM